MKLLMVTVIILIAVTAAIVGCSGNAEGPDVTIEPGASAIKVSSGYGLSFNSDPAAVDLPADYHLPARVMIYRIDNPGHQYILLIGPTSLECDEVRTASLSEEIVVKDLREGLTNLLLER